MAGQEYRPIACYRPTGGNPILIAGRFSLTVPDRINRQIIVTLLPVCRNGIMAQPLTGLCSDSNSNGKVLDEWL